MLQNAREDDGFQQDEDEKEARYSPGLSAHALFRSILESNPGKFTGARYIRRPLDEVILVESLEPALFFAVRKT